MWWLSFLLYISIFQHVQSFPLLLIVSFGGFRWDYPLLYGPLHNFSRLEQRGVRGHSLIPTFTTAKYPNHYTLITGLYEESHGLVSDEIYNRKMNKIFRANENMSSEWWPFPSILTINEQKNDARTGVIGWPQDSISVSKYEPYRKERSFKEIVDQILGWFNDPTEPINLGAIYFHEPYLTGRLTGPYSNEMRTIINQCDQYIGYLLNEIDKNIQLKNNLHLIITSDHGMEQINATNKPMYLEDYVDINKLKAFGTETVLNIFLNSLNDIGEIFQNLSQIPHSRIYKKESISERFHYKNNENIGDLILIVEPGYELYRRSFHGGNDVHFDITHGNSGYDNQIDSMKTIIYASGPQLKENVTLTNATTLYSVDIFLLMCLILNIEKCSPSNGSLINVQSFFIDSTKINHMIEKETEKLYDGPMGLVIYLLVLVSFVLMLIMAVVWSAVSYRNATSVAQAAHLDATTIAEQNQYKFTQINDRKLHSMIEDENL